MAASGFLDPILALVALLSLRFLGNQTGLFVGRGRKRASAASSVVSSNFYAFQARGAGPHSILVDGYQNFDKSIIVSVLVGNMCYVIGSLYLRRSRHV